MWAGLYPFISNPLKECWRTLADIFYSGKVVQSSLTHKGLCTWQHYGCFASCDFTGKGAWLRCDILHQNCAIILVQFWHKKNKPTNGWSKKSQTSLKMHQIYQTISAGAKSAPMFVGENICIHRVWGLYSSVLRSFMVSIHWALLCAGALWFSHLLNLHLIL